MNRRGFLWRVAGVLTAAVTPAPKFVSHYHAILGPVDRVAVAGVDLAGGASKSIVVRTGLPATLWRPLNGGVRAGKSLLQNDLVDEALKVLK